MPQRDLRFDDKLKVSKPDGSDRVRHSDGVPVVADPFASHNAAVRSVDVLYGSPPLFLGCQGTPDPAQFVGLTVGESEGECS